MNVGKPWSEMDLADLRNSLEHGDSVEQIAEFLCRDRHEVEAKIAEINVYRPAAETIYMPRSE